MKNNQLLKYNAHFHHACILSTHDDRFNQDIGITGAILTNMDGDTRWGSALSVHGVSGKPIKFVSVGEGMDDLEPFFSDRMASKILGLGDVQTWIGKVKVIFVCSF